jgi:hypothetical protein
MSLADEFGYVRVRTVELLRLLKLLEQPGGNLRLNLDNLMDVLGFAVREAPTMSHV